MSVKLTCMKDLVLLETPKAVETSSKILLDQKTKQQLAKEDGNESSMGIFKVVAVGPRVAEGYPLIKPGVKVFVNNPDAITPAKFGAELFLYTYASTIDFIVEGEIIPDTSESFDMSAMDMHKLKVDVNDYDTLA